MRHPLHSDAFRLIQMEEEVERYKELLEEANTKMNMINFYKKALFDRGVKYAKSELEKGRDIDELRHEADNPFDFNDFDRGILHVCRDAIAISKAIANIPAP